MLDGFSKELTLRLFYLIAKMGYLVLLSFVNLY